MGLIAYALGILGGGVQVSYCVSTRGLDGVGARQRGRQHTSSLRGWRRDGQTPAAGSGEEEEEASWRRCSGADVVVEKRAGRGKGNRSRRTEWRSPQHFFNG